MTRNQGYAYRIELGSKAAGHSTHSYLTQHFPHSNAEEWQARLDAGEISLDGCIARGSEPLRAGSVLIWNRPGWIEPETPQHYETIYRDAWLLVVDKPSGLPTLPGAGFYRNTLLSLVQADVPDARPLHRLGRATSGLVLFALDRQTTSILTSQWERIDKQYLALADGIAQRDSYDIRTPIGKLAHPRLGSVYAACETGKHARSVARVRERRERESLFEVDLHTGRPHQIRIHLASIGHPLVGDPLYTSGGIPRSDHPGLPGDGGYALHASRMALDHPISGQPLVLEAPTPGKQVDVGFDW